MPIAQRRACTLAAEQLEEVQEYVELGRPAAAGQDAGCATARSIEKLLDQLESVTDLLETVGPLANEGFDKADRTCWTSWSSKGYFGFARGGMRIVDNVVTSFSEEDVDRLGDNVVLILNTVKEMTQPEIMSFVRNTLQVAEREVAKPVDTSYSAPAAARCATRQSAAAWR